jgi:hypothetical protein
MMLCKGVGVVFRWFSAMHDHAQLMEHQAQQGMVAKGKYS